MRMLFIGGRGYACIGRRACGMARVRALRGGRRAAQRDLVVEEGHDVVVDAVLGAEIEVEAVAEHLRSGVRDRVGVGLGVGRWLRVRVRP